MRKAGDQRKEQAQDGGSDLNVISRKHVQLLETHDPTVEVVKLDNPIESRAVGGTLLIPINVIDVRVTLNTAAGPRALSHATQTMMTLLTNKRVFPVEAIVGTKEVLLRPVCRKAVLAQSYTSVRRCGRINNKDGVRHDPQRIEALRAMPLPTTAGEFVEGSARALNDASLPCPSKTTLSGEGCVNLCLGFHFLQVKAWDPAIPIHEQHHELLISLNWSIIKKEYYPIIHACDKLETYYYAASFFIVLRSSKHHFLVLTKQGTLESRSWKSVTMV
ncbi:hypothetical protein PHPALM_30448 [Phytophthora palmivora]|uniref:Uncharacterized protein n=1 Tax=Phytophthora palmivora TaxID=4796 RepID=A0A2P4X548_9STRA|nr:hypothetical protein PHPALM_30448 [Phytophthora palmivora]